MQRTAVNKLLNEYDAQRGKTAAKGDNHPQLKEMQNWLNKTRLSKPGKYAGEYQYVLTQYEVMLNKEHKVLQLSDLTHATTFFASMLIVIDPLRHCCPRSTLPT